MSFGALYFCFCAAATTSCTDTAVQNLGKRVTERADPIPMWAVFLLELAAVHAASPYVRLTAGYACLLIHGRLRNSDAKCVVHADALSIVDALGHIAGGYWEAVAVGTKTAMSDETTTVLFCCPWWHR